MRNKIIPYNPKLRERAKFLRNNATISEKRLWKFICKKSLGVQFHRQVPMLDYIVDFYCHEIGLAIEIDGSIHEHQFLYDAKRQIRLEKEGLKFLRFSNEEIKLHVFEVLKTIQSKVNELMSE